MLQKQKRLVGVAPFGFIVLPWMPNVAGPKGRTPGFLTGMSLSFWNSGVLVLLQVSVLIIGRNIALGKEVLFYLIFFW